MSQTTVSIPVQALQSTLRALTATRDQLNLQIAAIQAQLPQQHSAIPKAKSGLVDLDFLRKKTKGARTCQK